MGDFDGSTGVCSGRVWWDGFVGSLRARFVYAMYGVSVRRDAMWRPMASEPPPFTRRSMIRPCSRPTRSGVRIVFNALLSSVSWDS